MNRRARSHLRRGACLLLLTGVLLVAVAGSGTPADPSTADEVHELTRVRTSAQVLQWPDVDLPIPRLLGPEPPPGNTEAEPTPTDAAAPAAGSGSFPIGWYDRLSGSSSLPRMAVQGMNAVMPYHSGSRADPHVYLDTASSSGLRVLLEIPRDLVKGRDRDGIARYVRTYESHEALLGWYLADEPSKNPGLGPLYAADAKRLYDAIKAEDPGHPVAIAFGTGEDPRPYLPALDVMMVAGYPARHGSHEFDRFSHWTALMNRAATLARDKAGFFPVIQAYGEPKPLLGLGSPPRLPTVGEQRYMVFSTLQNGATGVFFWSYYRTHQAWADKVLEPIVDQLNEMRPALEAGERQGVVTDSQASVRATAFTDPATDRSYIVSVQYGDESVNAPLRLGGDLAGHTRALLMSDPPETVNITNGTLPQGLGRFEVKVYRLGDG